MRKIIFSILLLNLFCFAASSALAQCACVTERKNITAYNELKLADAVFVGTVLEIKKSARDANNDYVETVKFEVKNAWKRDLETIITVRNNVTFCFNGFDEKEEWLIYAYDNGDDTFRTFCCCSRTKLLAKAAEDLKEFEEKGEKPTNVKTKSSQIKAKPNKSMDVRAKQRLCFNGASVP